MIDITKYNNLDEDNEIILLLKNSFNCTKNKLNFVNKKTIIISITSNMKKIGTISMISNNDLIHHLKKKLITLKI